MKRRLNILFVTQNYPYPGVLHGGGQDFWHLIEALRTRHTIYVLTFDDPVSPISEDALRPYVEDVHVIRYATTLPQKAKAVLRALKMGYRFETARRTWEMRRAVADWCRRYRIDVLHCGWADMGVFFAATDQPLVRVLDEVDLQFRIDEFAVQQGTLSASIAAHRKSLELGYARQADFVITRSVFDQQMLQRLIPSVDVLVLPPVAHAAELLCTELTAPQPGTVLFVGAMNRDANRAGVLWFVQHVWKTIRAQVPTAKLMIVGAHPPDDIVRLGREPGITVTGYVPDVCPYYQKAQVVIAPLHQASGQLNKIIDGLAAGRPVVATPIANAGTNAPCVIVAEQPAAFAEAVIRLLTDESHWQHVAQASRQYARKHFDWSTDALEARYESYSAAKPGLAARP